MLSPRSRSFARSNGLSFVPLAHFRRFLSCRWIQVYILHPTLFRLSFLLTCESSRESLKNAPGTTPNVARHFFCWLTKLSSLVLPLTFDWELQCSGCAILAHTLTNTRWLKMVPIQRMNSVLILRNFISLPNLSERIAESFSTHRWILKPVVACRRFGPGNIRAFYSPRGVCSSCLGHGDPWGNGQESPHAAFPSCSPAKR